MNAQVGRLRTVCRLHVRNGLLYDALDGAAPASMNGCYGVLPSVVDEQRDAVGCADSDSYVREMGHHRIDALQACLSVFFRQREKRLVNPYGLRKMHLMGHDETVVADAKLSAQQSSVLADGLSIVATVTVDVELAIRSRTESPTPRRTERYHILM